MIKGLTLNQFFIKIIQKETIKKIIVGTLQRGENTEESYEEIKKKYNVKEKTIDDLLEFEYFK